MTTKSDSSIEIRTAAPSDDATVEPLGAAATKPTSQPALTTPSPWWLWIPATLAILLITLPLLGLLSRVPWPRIGEVLTSQAARDALWLSLRTCFASMLLCIVLGLPLAVILGRMQGRLLGVVRVLTALPIAMPPVVAGLALLAAFGRRGLLGPTLEAFGITIGFTTVAVILAQTFVAMPYFVISVEGALRSIDDEYEHISASLGADPSTTLRRITLPLLAPAIAAGATLALARALGEFGATLAFAGSLQGTTRTMPLEIYLQREAEPDIAYALAFVLLVIGGLLVGLAQWVQHRWAA